MLSAQQRGEDTEKMRHEKLKNCDNARDLKANSEFADVEGFVFVWYELRL
jgi:hypothetical protein